MTNLNADSLLQKTILSQLILGKFPYQGWKSPLSIKEHYSRHPQSFFTLSNTYHKSLPVPKRRQFTFPIVDKSCGSRSETFCIPHAGKVRSLERAQEQHVPAIYVFSIVRGNALPPLPPSMQWSLMKLKTFCQRCAQHTTHTHTYIHTHWHLPISY
jgi:hypothetical protein